MPYSLHGLDPQLMRQIAEYVPESPYAAVATRDPSFGPATADFMTRLARPSLDTAMGVPQPIMTSQEDDGPSAGQIIGGIVSAPFRALGMVKEGLEDALGHRNARARSAEDLQIEIATKLGLISDALTDDQKAAIFPDQYAANRAAIMARGGSGDGDTAMGRNPALMPLPQARKTGVWEWLSGEQQRQRERQLAQVAMVQRAIEENLRAEELRTQKARTGLLETQGEGARWDVQQDYKYGDLERGLGLDKTRADIDQSRASTDYSRAAIGNMGADNARADAAEARAAEAARRDTVMDRLRQRAAREDIRGSRLENREKTLDLRERDALGPFGVDTGYDKDGRPFNRRQFLSAYNAAQPDEKAGVLGGYNVPTKRTGGFFGFGGSDEPDYDAMRMPPVQTFETSGEPTEQRQEEPQMSIAPVDPGRVDQIFSQLAKGLPTNSTRHADLKALASKLAAANDERSFYQIAKAAGLSKQMGVALWQGTGR